MSHTQTSATTLSARISAAPVEQTGEMLEEAWRFIHGSGHWTSRTIGPGDRFGAFLNISAYHDAAMMLIPESWRIVTFTEELDRSGWLVKFRDTTRDIAMTAVNGANLPLAIAAAAVRVKENSDGTF